MKVPTCGKREIIWNKTVLHWVSLDSAVSWIYVKLSFILLLGISSSVPTFLTLLLHFKLCFPYVYPTGATPLYPLALLAHLLRISLYLLNVYILVITDKVFCTIQRFKKFFEKSHFSALHILSYAGDRNPCKYISSVRWGSWCYCTSQHRGLNCGLDKKELWFDYRQRQEIFLFSTVFNNNQRRLLY